MDVEFCLGCIYDSCSSCITSVLFNLMVSTRWMSMKLNTIVFHALMLLVSRMFALSFKAGKALFFDTLETLECCFFSLKMTKRIGMSNIK